MISDINSNLDELLEELSEVFESRMMQIIINALTKMDEDFNNGEPLDLFEKRAIAAIMLEEYDLEGKTEKEIEDAVGRFIEALNDDEEKNFLGLNDLITDKK